MGAVFVSQKSWTPDPTKLAEILDFYQQQLSHWPLSTKSRMHLNLILEELIVNLLHYASAPQDSPLEVGLEIREDRLYGQIRDAGIPFNPLERPDPQCDQPLLNRKVGGLGIFFVKKLVESLEYQRENQHNQLRFILRLHPES